MIDNILGSIREKVNNPYYVEPNRSLCNYGIIDFIKVITVMLEKLRPGLVVVPYRSGMSINNTKDILEYYQKDVSLTKKEYIMEGKERREYKKEAPDEIIAWEIISSKYVTKNGVEEINPVFDGIFQKEGVGGIIYYSHTLDYKLGFTIITTHSLKSIELELWLKNMIEYLDPAFRILGISRLGWLGSNKIQGEQYNLPGNELLKSIYRLRTSETYYTDVEVMRDFSTIFEFSNEETKLAYQDNINNLITKAKDNIKKVNYDIDKINNEQ